jgi:hypothetical protein
MGEGPGVRAQWISQVLFKKWVVVSPQRGHGKEILPRKDRISFVFQKFEVSLKKN